MSEIFSIKAVIDDSDLEPFVFEDAEGVERELPHPGTLTARQALKLEGNKLEEMLEEIEPGSSDILLDIPGFALEGLMKAWIEHGGSGKKLGGSKPSYKKTRKS